MDSWIDDEIEFEELQSRLFNTYQQQSPLRKSIVQLLSVFYGPTTIANTVAALNYIGITTKTGKKITSGNLKPQIVSLIEDKLLIYGAGHLPQCDPLIVEMVTRDAVKLDTYELMRQAVTSIFHPRRNHVGRVNRIRHICRSNDELYREARLALYDRDYDALPQLFLDYSNYNYYASPVALEDFLLDVVNNPFDAEWLSTLSVEHYGIVLKMLLVEATSMLEPADQLLQLVENHAESAGEFNVLLVEQYLLRNRFADAEIILDKIVDEQSQVYGTALRGTLALLLGETKLSLDYYATATKLARKQVNKKAVIGGIAGLFYMLALLKSGEPKHLKQAITLSTPLMQSSGYLSNAYRLLHEITVLHQGQLSVRQRLLEMIECYRDDPNDSFGMFFSMLCLYWLDLDEARATLPRPLAFFAEQANDAGLHWLATEAAEMLHRLVPDSDYGEWLHQRQSVSIVDTLQPHSTWELSLKALTNVAGATAKHSVKSERRLAWFLTLYTKHWLLQPKEQKLSAKGTWTKGRVIALSRLAKNPAEFDYLTPQDLQACNHIKYDYYSGTQYSLNRDAVKALAGHPLVFWEESPTVRVEIVAATPELVVEQGGDGSLTLHMEPAISPGEGITLVKETPTRIKVLEVTSEHQKIAEILGKRNQLTVPAAGQDQVLAAIQSVSSLVTIHSDIGGDMDDVDAIEADAKPHIHLMPAGDGLKLSMLTRPFPNSGTYYPPGTGRKTVIAEIDGKRSQATRDLAMEKRLAQDVQQACPALQSGEEAGGEWILDEPETCLELLLQLEAVEENIILEWPEGEKLKIRNKAGIDGWRLHIKQEQDWFEVSGELELDDGNVMDMQALLSLLDQTSSRFVPIGDGQFLALTQAFRNRLDEFRAYSERHGKGARFHPLAALALEETLDEVGQLKADKNWKSHIKKLKESKTVVPEVPSTLQAELRDYQQEGFQWLAQLAHWGVGACLADDMGLGKTLQALAVILLRAPDGPTLVIAPTSVGANWVSEAQRFAPTLNVMQFGSGDRQAVVDQLSGFDLLVCSYGLLQQPDVADLLAEVDWQTIVLDEAQAIKNSATKRSQAAMKLKSGFKVITTGTPIENHLGELWNLFRFINPGLLGSLDKFNQRFATPIERYQDKQARLQLKKLIQPFMLRRTKTQVLDELPSRTEITLHVELSGEEKALYEALRRDAIAKLTNTNAKAGAKHLQVLAEITRLRRMCCNPQLVMPEMATTSAKLQLFGEVLEELLSNRHKALVFSQFVDHLTILRQYLDDQKITYQYLDGSTPAKQRKKRVDAFQSGEGNVFLISLKAGGTGLNLTAADYVIHMDPWWNPAVEDQASDRAHRIGQTRPVTIYRLVTRGTIEEKIVELHNKKRDLADSLLEGSDISGKLSTDALLKLMSEV
ncbi:DEAD/DEAH box helicase [Leptothoe spongobia]|uniref:DEAD/DEAH box helicase n=1 Tax=Leptothoe spongobia TAU-MAC 1115 TaxID=1967444 RepID=A0A947DEG2_9CYAN|nr:DEAD/DEAH box helicase [Leptothoe spongobia]MBT9315395.1 DEAD/DEAH box helicase [Leptothoe spongobia TAU-MAC 1115]